MPSHSFCHVTRSFELVFLESLFHCYACFATRSIKSTCERLFTYEIIIKESQKVFPGRDFKLSNLIHIGLQKSWNQTNPAHLFLSAKCPKSVPYPVGCFCYFCCLCMFLEQVETQNRLGFYNPQQPM